MGNSNGKIFAPVSTTDIATVIGDTTDMGKSDNVNVWAKYKPIEAKGNPYHSQTDEDRKAAAWGILWDVDNDESPCARAATILYEKANQNSAEWKWEKPTISRMGDFIGYNHNAINPYSYENLSGNNDHIKRFVLRQSRSSDAELILNIMPEIDDVALENYAIVGIYKRDGITPEIAETGYTLYDLDVLKEIPLDIRVKPTVEDEPHYYDMIFAATNQFESGYNNARWIYFPNSILSFAMTGYFRVEYNTYEPIFEAITSGGWPVSSRIDTVRQISLFFSCFHSVNYRTEGKVVLHVWNDDSGWGSGADYEFPLVEDGDMTFREVNIRAATNDSTAEKTMLAMTIYYRDADEPINGGADYVSMKFDWENNRCQLGVAGVEDGVSVWDLLSIKENY